MLLVEGYVASDVIAAAGLIVEVTVNSVLNAITFARPQRTNTTSTSTAKRHSEPLRIKGLENRTPTFRG
jgi:hypothetical protein